MALRAFTPSGARGRGAAGPPEAPGGPGAGLPAAPGAMRTGAPRHAGARRRNILAAGPHLGSVGGAAGAMDADVVRMTWERLGRGEDAEAVRELLRTMAFLDPDSIPVAVFEDFQLLMPALEEHGFNQVQLGPPALVSIHALT